MPAKSHCTGKVGLRIWRSWVKPKSRETEAEKPNEAEAFQRFNAIRRFSTLGPSEFQSRSRQTPAKSNEQKPKATTYYYYIHSLLVSYWYGYIIVITVIVITFRWLLLYCNDEQTILLQQSRQMPAKSNKQMTQGGGEGDHPLSPSSTERVITWCVPRCRLDADPTHTPMQWSRLCSGHIGAHPSVALHYTGGGRARRFAFVPPNVDGFMTVREIVGHELDWLRRRFIFVPPNLLDGSNLLTALLHARGCPTIINIVLTGRVHQSLYCHKYNYC